MNERLKSPIPKLSVAASALVLMAACSSPESDHHDESTKHEAHFSVVCTDGAVPSITAAETAGTLPYHPDFDGDKTGDFIEEFGADAYVDITCIDTNGQNSMPIIEQDHTREGACLGYEQNQYHLTFDVVASGNNEVQFFDREDNTSENMGLIGALNNGGDLTIAGVSIHDHNLENTAEQHHYNENNCGHIA